MSTTLAHYDLGTDRWVEIPATWEIYESLLKERGEKSRPRYIFCDGGLTIVSPGGIHERAKRRLGFFLDYILTFFDFDFEAFGSVTLLSKLHPRTGTEADETYYLTNAALVAGKDALLMGVDPPPDLTIEVVVSHPEAKALRAYAKFGVREVWVVRATGLEFLALGAHRKYKATPTSVVLPFLRSDEMTFWLFRDDVKAARLRRVFMAWVQDTLAPRFQADDQN
jgi:Uma2 family endonuclease